jgi:hypothetical protein
MEKPQGKKNRPLQTLRDKLQIPTMSPADSEMISPGDTR